MSASAINSPDAPPAIGPYSQGVHAGSFVFLSGQIPLVRDTGKFVEGGIREQTEQVIANITALLKSQNLKLSDVVKATVFLADMEEFTAMNEVYAKHFTGTPPARSTVQVARLPRDARVEIEVIAQVRLPNPEAPDAP
jgi:2-iminobutanoate/2-iminopropanoate deaminase